MKYFSAEQREAERYDRSMARYEDASVKAYTSLAVLNAGQAAIFTVGLAAAMVLCAFEIKAGYMELVEIDKILKRHEIKEKVIFYGIEDIATTNPVWKVFSAIKKLTPNFVQFNKLPSSKLQGVVTRVEM